MSCVRPELRSSLSPLVKVADSVVRSNLDDVLDIPEGKCSPLSVAVSRPMNLLVRVVENCIRAPASMVAVIVQI